MSIRKWFGKTDKASEREAYDADDLIVLGRLDEAEAMLRNQVKKNPRDLKAALKLADVYQRTGRLRETVDQYIHVAERMAADGFYDKAIALLAKAVKLAPSEGSVQIKMQSLERMRKLERRLTGVMRTIAASKEGGKQAATASYLELRNIWTELAASTLIDQLDDRQLAQLLKSMQLQKIGSGKVLVEKGEDLEELVLITRGQVEVLVKLPNGVTTVLRQLEPGDVVGDRALFEHEPWPATCKSTAPTVLLKLDRSGLERALQGNPDPRQLIQTLRQQGLDSKIVKAVRRAEEA